MATSWGDFYQNMVAKRLGLPIVAEKEAPLGSIVIVSVFLFMAWTLLNVLIVYEQFSRLQIVTVSGLFLSILFVFIYFFTDLLKGGLIFSRKNVLYALLLFALMVVLASTFSHAADIYVHTYPLLGTEIGLGWHQDTAFHVSHIQSILHFGYPSIGQHGVPLNMYHVLSHFIDALIIWIAQVEPYDSYGLLATFKIWLLVSSIAAFFAAAMKNIHPLFYLFIFASLSPVLTGTWHVVLSHGLWFTTILVIFSSLKVFQILIAEKLSNKDYYFLLTLLVLVSFGKVSTGFMYASIVGVFLLLKYPKDKRVYLIGVLLMGFFVYYSQIMRSTVIDKGFSSYDFSVLSFNYYWTAIIHPVLAQFKFVYTQNTMVHISIATLTTLVLLFRDKNMLRLLYAIVASYLLLITIVGISLRFSTSDVFYFYLGFTYVLNLFIFMSVVYSLKENRVFYSTERNQLYVGLLSVIAMVILVMSLYITSVSPKNYNKLGATLKSINDRAFVKVNKILPNEKKMSITKLLAGKVDNTVFEGFKRPLYSLRESINQILVNHKVSKGEALLFIPKEVYEKNISKFGGVTWADGMLLYAITGVPMLYAIKDHAHKGYSQGRYLKEYEWKQRSSFSPVPACSNNAAKIIIELIDFDTLSFETYDCEQDK